MTYSEIILGSAAILGLVAVMSIAGEQDYRDALAAERTACLMVAQGYWPPETAEGYDCPQRIARSEL